jgi:hypothetical protein
METTPHLSLPRWKCHKVVHAIKLASVEFIPGTSTVNLHPAEPEYPTLVRAGPFSRRVPAGSDPGYFVVYPDGYESWSPTKAFEEGYTRIGETDAETQP